MKKVLYSNIRDICSVSPLSITKLKKHGAISKTEKSQYPWNDTLYQKVYGH